MKYTAVYPDGREEELLNVPHYDFNWQIVYEFSKPVHAACGNHGSRRSGVGQLDQEQATTRGLTRTSSGASRAGMRCSAPHLNAVVQLKSPIVPTPPVQVSQR